MWQVCAESQEVPSLIVVSNQPLNLSVFRRNPRQCFSTRAVGETAAERCQRDSVPGRRFNLSRIARIPCQ